MATPGPGNTGVSILQWEKWLSKPRETGGVDTLELSLYGNWPASVWDGVRGRFEAGQAAARSGVEGGSYLKTDEGDLVLVREKGFGRGAAGFTWVLEWNGCSIAIADRFLEHDSLPSLFVTMGSVPLMRDGYASLWEGLLDVLRRLGYVHSREIVARVDACIDLAHVDVRDFVRPMWLGGSICRARKGSLHWDGVPGVEAATGFTIGKEIHLRVYEKLAECAEDPEKLYWLVVRRWGCVPKKATRVEFQVRGDVLKERGIRSVVDLGRKLPGLTDWLSSEWFRLVEDFDRSNRHHDRSRVLPLWESVQRAFSTWTGEGPRVQRVEPRGGPSFKRLREQALGCLARVIAGGRQCVASKAEWMEWVTRWADEGYLDASARIAAKERALFAAGRALGKFEESAIPF